MPESGGCKTICVAGKQTQGCVYVSGVDVHERTRFLERLAHSGAIASFVRRDFANFDHLLFDVGFD